MPYLVPLILLLLPSYLLRFSILGIPTTALEVLIYAVFLYGISRAVKTGFRSIPLRIFLPISLLIIALVASIIISPDKSTALGEFKGFFVDPLLVFWLVYQFVRKEQIPKLFYALIISGAFVAIHTIIQRFLGHITPDGRVVGLFGYSPNYVALYLAPITVLLTAYGLQLTAKNKWRLAVSGLLLAINLTAIYFSGSRGGVLAVFAGLGIFAIASLWGWIRERLSSQIVIAIVIIVAIYTSWFLFKPDFSVSEVSGGRIATSNNLRWQIWQTTLELGGKHSVLGVGLGNYQNAFNDLTKNRGNFPEYITPQAATPHNIFLMFWLSTGLLGLVAFLWLLVEFYRECFRKFKLKQVIIILAVFSSIIIYGLIESSIWKNDLSVIFWIMWGLVWVEEKSKIKNQNAK